MSAWLTGNSFRAREFHDDGSRHAERYCCEQLIANSEERPERINSSEGIFNPLPEKISPGGYNHRAGKKNRRVPTRPAERLPDMAERVLQHETSDAGAGVNDGQDKERFEHDGEVIPERHDGLSA